MHHGRENWAVLLTSIRSRSGHLYSATISWHFKLFLSFWDMHSFNMQRTVAMPSGNTNVACRFGQLVFVNERVPVQQLWIWFHEVITRRKQCSVGTAFHMGRCRVPERHETQDRLGSGPRARPSPPQPARSDSTYCMRQGTWCNVQDPSWKVRSAWCGVLCEWNVKCGKWKTQSTRSKHEFAREHLLRKASLKDVIHHKPYNHHHFKSVHLDVARENVPTKTKQKNIVSFKEVVWFSC